MTTLRPWLSNSIAVVRPPRPLPIMIVGFVVDDMVDIRNMEMSDVVKVLGMILDPK